MPARSRPRRAAPWRSLKRSRGAPSVAESAGGAVRAGAVLWQELTSPEIAALDRERDRHRAAGRIGRAARQPHAGRHRHHARRRGRGGGGRQGCGADGDPAAALVRLLCPSHALRRHRDAAARDDDGAGRGHRRRASSPTASAGSSSSTATAAMAASSTFLPRSSATASTAARGSPPDLFPARARRDRRASAVGAGRHGPCLRVRDGDDPHASPS